MESKPILLSLYSLLEQRCNIFAADDYYEYYHANLRIINWSLNILSYQLHNKFPLKCDTPEPCSNPELEQ